MLDDKDKTDYHFDSPLLRMVQEIFLVVAIAAAVVLNSSVVFVICRNKQLRKRTTNIFILNLVVSNMLMAVFVMPLSLATLIEFQWNIDTLLCRVSSLFRTFIFFFFFPVDFRKEVALHLCTRQTVELGI